MLPFEPRNVADIHPYAERSQLEEAWENAMDDIENSGLMLEGRSSERH